MNQDRKSRQILRGIKCMFYAQTKETVGEIRRFLYFGQQTKSSFFCGRIRERVAKEQRMRYNREEKDAKGERIW